LFGFGFREYAEQNIEKLSNVSLSTPVAIFRVINPEDEYFIVCRNAGKPSTFYAK
jgi:hypothetical protein